MKRFRVVSAVFVGLTAAIFLCEVWYLAQLYGSIREDARREVMGAIATADIDDLWFRAEVANQVSNTPVVGAMASTKEADSGKRVSQINAAKDGSGTFVTTTQYPDGNTTVSRKLMDEGESYTNRIMSELGQQFHAVMDPYLGLNMASIDSILGRRLSDRGIKSPFVAVEVVDSTGKILCENPRIPAVRTDYDEFVFCYNQMQGLSYRAYITPLTRHILSEMLGVIVTSFLLMGVFAIEFCYLFRTVSRLRTIEEMKDDFTSNMTHELKTPIAIAYSANDALLNFGADSDPAKREHYLRIANRQLKLLGELVENILAVSMQRRKTLKLSPEKVSVVSMVQELAASWRMRPDRSIEIDISPLEENISVTADKTHLSNVLNNIIDNAVKYSCDAGGKPITGDAVRIRITLDNHSIRIEDHGIGIPARSIPYIFNRFYRVPRGNRQDVRGYGIGLYYVRQVLQQMGMSISVTSREGVGSIFTIQFNRHEKDITGRG